MEELVYITGIFLGLGAAAEAANYCLDQVACYRRASEAYRSGETSERPNIFNSRRLWKDRIKDTLGNYQFKPWVV